MNAKDAIDKALTGILQIHMRHTESGEEKVVTSNLVVNGAYVQLTNLLAGYLTNRHVSQVAFGVGDTVPVVSDAGVTGPVVWLPTVASYPTLYSVKFEATWGTTFTDATELKEAGLFSADTTLVARTTFQGMRKSVGWEWNVAWVLSYSV